MSLSLPKIVYKENQAIQKQRSQDRTFSTKKERLSESKGGIHFLIFHSFPISK